MSGVKLGGRESDLTIPECGLAIILQVEVQVPSAPCRKASPSPPGCREPKETTGKPVRTRFDLV